MNDSSIISQVVKIEKSGRKTATHFVLFNGTQMRYLIDLHGGKIRLSQNLSPYSRKLAFLMRFMIFLPFSLLCCIKLGYFIKAELHAEVEKCRKNTNKKYWNMIIGTYDEKQKLVIQCFNDTDPAVFIKIGNEATQEEMNAEICFLKKRKKYTSFAIPELLDSSSRSEGSNFNIQVTKEFFGRKVEPMLTQEIVDIYQELSRDVQNGFTFSHGDFAPWNLKRNHQKYTLFDWEHCGYRMPGFDLMHYVEMIEIVINKKGFSEAFESGLASIQKYIPDFEIDKDMFLDEFRKLRTQIK